MHTAAMACRSLVFACLLSIPGQLAAEPAGGEMIRPGEYVYVQESNIRHAPGGKNFPAADQYVHYSVRPDSFGGIPTWKIGWQSHAFFAIHHIRQSDGAPVYMRREDRTLKRWVEIHYAQQPHQAHIYRRSSPDEYFERKIRDETVSDMGALPQLLALAQKHEEAPIFSFRCINYEDGKVYPMRAKQVGFSYIQLGMRRVRSMIYQINVDRWWAAFHRPVRLFIPVQKQLGSFVAYDGPSPTGTGEIIFLRLMATDTRLARSASSVNNIQP